MELYRKASIGTALDNALDDLITAQTITMPVADKIKLQYDRSLIKVMNENLKNKLTFKGKCKTFNELDHVRKFVLEDVNMQIDAGTKINVKNVKLVACDAKVLDE
eukprot:m.258642 g.258642  ORF g.258642 m.258642 type:complete len:105 (+) comp36830_c0_seq1:320-634(+)